MKILFCGTHPNVATGYGNIVYHFVQELRQLHEIVIFAFDAQASSLNRAEGLRVKIISPQRINGQRFGEGMLRDTIASESPDLVFFYNDILVVSALMERIQDVKVPKWVYLDMVYEWQDHRLIKIIIDRCDRLFVFTPFWKRHILEMWPDFERPISILYHGLKPPLTFSSEAFQHYHQSLLPDIKATDFIVLNLNRNTLRKRWDLTIRAFLLFLKTNNMPSDAYLYVGCQKRETLDIDQVIWAESKMLGLDHDQVLRHLIEKPGGIPDDAVQFLYERCQVGLNTCNGEGFGLCCFEHAAHGKPQIVSHVGGMTDCLVGAKFVYPVGHAHVCYEETRGVIYEFRVGEFAEAIDYYYHHPEARIRDGQQVQATVTSSKFKWPEIAREFADELSNSVK